MNDMLKTAVEVGTGKGANLNGWPFGGKTGTSQMSRDALFVGYTAKMVTGVWLGNDNDTKTTLSGGNVPVAIWSAFMTKAHQGLQVADIPGGSYAGQSVAQQIVDPATGQPVIDPNTGAPMIQYVDATTGQPVQSPIHQGDGVAAAQSIRRPASRSSRRSIRPPACPSIPPLACRSSRPSRARRSIPIPACRCRS